MSKFRSYETDVLVIGGGGAGITAAVAASKHNAKVMIVSKGRIGNSGNTIMIGGSYAMDGESAYYDYGIEEADPSLTRKVLFDSIVNDGFHLSDQNLVKQFVEESPWIVNQVRLWAEEAGQTFKFGKPATWAMNGRAMGRALYHGLKGDENITELHDVSIVELIKKDDRVIGAIGIDIYTGEFVKIYAKAVVMGTGGFQPFSLKNTNTDMSGDGVAMAFRAGATVADMEFLLFLLTAIEPQEIRGSIMPVYFKFFGFDYKVTDKDGNVIDIPEELHAIECASELSKLIDIYYYGKSISEGKGINGGIYFDFSDHTDEEIIEMFDGLLDYYGNFYKRGFYHADNVIEYRDIILRNRRIQVSMGNEYTLGGIVVDERMASDIQGLYAAGECTSGTFGSNRVADAVTEMMVHGYRAGISATEDMIDDLQKDDQAAQAIMDRYLSVFDNEDGIGAAQANLEIERISDEGIYYYRSEEGLEKAIAEYEALENKLRDVSLKSKSRAYNMEWLAAIQAENRLLCSKLSAVMAKGRKESRGLHIRSDYPLVDNENFLIRQMAKLVDGQIKYTSRKPIVTEFELPEASKEDYFEYMLKHEMGLENLVYND